MPASVQRKARIRLGDRLEFNVSGGVITIMPKLPPADDEYTTAQRRVIDRQLAEGLTDIREGRLSQRFATVDEMLTSMQASNTTSLSARQEVR